MEMTISGPLNGDIMVSKFNDGKSKYFLIKQGNNEIVLNNESQVSELVNAMAIIEDKYD